MLVHHHRTAAKRGVRKNGMIETPLVTSSALFFSNTRLDGNCVLLGVGRAIVAIYRLMSAVDPGGGQCSRLYLLAVQDRELMSEVPSRSLVHQPPCMSRHSA